jgi:hypothetical protein
MHDVITVHPATTTILLHILKNITFTMAEIDWNELIQSKKSVKACDNYPCGNVMAEYNGRCFNKITSIYIVPKSKVDHYDRNDLHLNITHDDMVLNYVL